MFLFTRASTMSVCSSIICQASSTILCKNNRLNNVLWPGKKKWKSDWSYAYNTYLFFFKLFLFVCLFVFWDFFFFFWLKHVRSHFPNQELNPYPPPTLGAQSLNYLLDHKGSPSKLFLWLNFISLSIFYLFQVKSLLYTSL